MIIGILNRKGDIERRQCIRNTWGRWATDCGIHYVFLCGYENIVDYPRLVEDVLMLPCLDNYKALPEKTRWFCKWVIERTNSNYLFKCDDDTFIHVARLLDYDPQGNDYIGHLLGDYASGGAGYLLSRKAATIVGNNTTQYNENEDINTGQLLKENGIVAKNEPLFNHGLWNQKCFPAETNNIITRIMFQSRK